MGNSFLVSLGEYQVYKYILGVVLAVQFLICPVLAQNAPGARGNVLTPQGVAIPRGYNYAQPGVRYGGYPNYNPYNTIYGGYGNPYAPTYQGQYNFGGISTPVYGPPQLIRGNLYGINAGGIRGQFWRAPSGFYYPWVGGYTYNNYPIYVVPPNNTGASQTLPPISTVISDLNDYLDKAKEKGKINPADYQSLRRRASDLLSKQKSLSYAQGGVLDPDIEAEIRRDVEGLSSEVAHRVKP
jgi:hypothetical protein